MHGFSSVSTLADDQLHKEEIKLVWYILFTDIMGRFISAYGLKINPALLVPWIIIEGINVTSTLITFTMLTTTNILR
ncbi:hypothetical protein D3C78_1683500 [compost metagenome]